MAADVVSGVLHGQTLTLSLEAARLDSHSPSIQGAVRDISYGVLRYRGELEVVLDRLLQKPLDDGYTHALLLAALYQLVHTRAAPHAVVNNAVEAAPRKFRNLVNAVLRNYQRRQEELLAAARITAEGRTNHPQWWVKKLKAAYPGKWEGILSASQLHPPMTLRVNRRKSTVEKAQAELQASNIASRRTGSWALTLDKPVPVAQVPGFAEGRVSVQDAGAQWAAMLLDLKDGQRVLDACAAPGGKTGHMLETASLELTALDIDQARLDRVRQNLERLGLAAKLKKGDAAHPETWWDGRCFDRILADVPCSASGVVRRNPDIKWLRRPEDIRKFVRQQANILDALWQTLAPGGKLLYVTCSIFPEENVHQIQSFVARHADANRLALPEKLGDGQLLPDDDCDGFFFALLQRA
ncbi:MAG: 16S rRNA (cytosine(967)-C(5))-methyltransferase RsmB [Hydrogenophilaceae bacterium]|nr:16S rRNA (cytosine(967)-C(5))-methyltransferase RsmB [Hydrogenophilaceae bacterium]